MELELRISLIHIGTKKLNKIKKSKTSIDSLKVIIKILAKAKSSKILLDPTRGGGTHISGRTGMCHSNGSLFFYKKSLNMGPVFYQKILKHGSTFLTEPKILIAKFLKNVPIFKKNP